MGIGLSAPSTRECALDHARKKIYAVKGLRMSSDHPWRAFEEFGFGLVGFRVGTKQPWGLISSPLGPDPRQSRPCKRVDENRAAQPVVLIFQDGGVKSEISPKRIELAFLPWSDAAILGLLRHSTATLYEGASTGNSFHSQPSNS